MLKFFTHRISAYKIQPLRKYLKNHHYFPLVIIAAVGSVFTSFAAVIIYRAEFRHLQATFGRQADYLELSLQRQLDEYYQVTVALGAFLDASSQVRPDDFQKFTQPFLEQYAGIRGMAWLRKTSRTERPAYEAQMQQMIGSNFRIIERDQQLNLVRAGDRDFYLPITYGAPEKVYKKIYGLDHSVDPYFKEPILQAIDSQKIVITERIVLVTTSAAGVAFYRPVYRPNAELNTAEQRQENLLGLAYTIYQISDLVKEAFENIDLQGLDVYLLDTDASGDKRYLLNYNSETLRFSDQLPEKSIPDLKTIPLCRKAGLCDHNVKFAGRNWRLIIIPNQRFIGLYWATIATCTIGILITLILVVYFSLSIKRTEDLKAAMKQLQKTQSQLIQSEKMSSLGQLVAGVAHEINNPVSFIYGNLTHANTYIEDLFTLIEIYEQEYDQPSPLVIETRDEIDLSFVKQDLPKLLKSMKIGAERIEKIVQSLRNFSRMDEADLKSADLHEGIESTLIILQNRLKAQAESSKPIEIVKNYANLPLVECYAGQLNQVFMNLLTNAIDALEQHHSQTAKTITIQTELINNGKRVSISIRDNGPGIAPQVMENLYNPFFTTKPIGKGTGLGLSISYAIVVEKHQGELKCSSTLGKGTEFKILIPLNQSNSQNPKLRVDSHLLPANSPVK